MHREEHNVRNVAAFSCSEFIGIWNENLYLSLLNIAKEYIYISQEQLPINYTGNRGLFYMVYTICSGQQNVSFLSLVQFNACLGGDSYIKEGFASSFILPLNNDKN